MMNTSQNMSQNASSKRNLVFVGAYTLVFIAGLILNLISLVVFCRQSKSRSHTIVYMTNLAVADLLLVCTLPMRIYYHLGFSDLPQTLCEVLGLTLLVNMYGSIFLLTCISVDRCMAVCFPMSARVKDWRKKAVLVCLCVWILTIGASLPIYLFKKKKSNRGEHQCFGSAPVYATQRVAVATTLTIGFSVPLASILTCSWFLIRAIGRSEAVQTGAVDSQKIRRMITVSLVIFLVCFLPYHLILGLLYASPDRRSPEDAEGPNFPPALVSAYQYSLVLACFNAMLDPLVYYFTTETFRNNTININTIRRMLPLQSHSSDSNHRSQVPLNS
ncbi:lysophosphatidic acid receptor 4 [Megalops cyprinoides]|uniref:lysophosphatidic acid receptor 4 n=1 Tax=Megalops cyprinoides TaxID=118141 RepID=UPI00186404AB|nr:lysophosphatidic acid receptor 4 [Megalops cyprinoides]